MVSAINTALSGLTAASTRVNAAANNIANQNSTRTSENGETKVAPPPVLDVVQTTQEPAGVRAEVVDSAREPLKVFQPENPDADTEGFVRLPNVEPERELVDLKIASYDFKANLKTIQVQDNLFKSTLDIIT